MSETKVFSGDLSGIEDKFKQSDEKFRSLFEHSPIGVAFHRMIYDDEGKPVDFYYLEANKNFQEFTGADPTGKMVTEVFPGIEKDPDFDWIGTCARAARDGETVRFQKYLPPVDRWYDVVAFQNKPDHFVVSFLEITEQKKTEHALHQSQKLDAIGQLAGGIAHDFNNMLSGIMGAAEMLGLYLPDDDKARQFHDIIMQSSARAADLASKLLTFSKMGGQVSTVIEMHEVIKGTVDLLGNTIDRRISIKTDFATKRGTVTGDPSQLQNALLNLGINASQAVDGDGQICFGTRVVTLDEAYCSASSFDLEIGEYFEIEVRDNGCGINEEHLDKIFEPFFTTKADRQGTGLGLASVYGTVKQHRGAVDVYSEVGVGTVFHILLPLESRDGEKQQISADTVRGSGRILVVDDEDVLRVTVKAILENLGYDVLLAENGMKAIDIYKESVEPIDLVLLDMTMPVMNGRDCFEALQKHSPDVKVVLSSGFAREEDLAALKQRGVKGFLRKPYLSEQLSRVINDAITEA
jgi:signal transduction histidine kinase/CheY-like chemotaxis protein